jgi:predicted Zn finger-like uncharacterized protein
LRLYAAVLAKQDVVLFIRVNRLVEVLATMILTCPACATQYRLKDGAIPPEGRQVRCAACKHKWHQDGEGAAPAEDDGATAGGHYSGGEVGIAPPQPDPHDAEEPLASVPEAAAHEQMIAEEPQPEGIGDETAQAYGEQPYDEPAAVEPEPFAASAAVEQWDEPDAQRHEDYGFAAIPAMHDEDEPRRGGKLGWILGLILLVVVAAAAFWFLAPPELKARAGIAEAGESQLQLMLTTSDRQRLASGNELLAISGRVINSTDREQAVPPIHAELRDPANNRLVYQWTIAPPARSLAPGAAASFNSAEVDVPKGGESLSLRFAS